MESSGTICIHRFDAAGGILDNGFIIPFLVASYSWSYQFCINRGFRTDYYLGITKDSSQCGNKSLKDTARNPNKALHEPGFYF